MAPPLAALVLLPALVWAEDAPSPLSLRDAQAIARKVLALSRLPDKKTVRLRHYAPGYKSEDIDGKPIEGVPKWLTTSSAGAIPAKLDPNPLDTAIIYTVNGFFVHARTPSEAALILAHEVAHLELQHERRFLAEFCRLYREWKKQADAVCPRRSEDYVRFRRAQPWIDERLLGIERQHEYEADERGMRLASAAGYDARAYAPLLRRMAAMRERPGFVDKGTHPAPEDRAGHLEATALQEALADQEAF